MKRTAVVVGDGIVGLACACRLAQCGLETTLIGPADATASASWGNAGHLAVEQVEPHASAKAIRSALRQAIRGRGAVRTPLAEITAWLPFFLRLIARSGPARLQAGTAALAACMRRAAPAWRALLADIGHPEVLREDGHFVVWESSRSTRAGIAAWTKAETGPARFRRATSAELAQLGALVRTPVHGAVRFEGTGQFSDPGMLLGHLEQAIAAAGVHRKKGRVSGVFPKRATGAQLRTEEGERLEADAIVVAAGVGSARLLSATGLNVPIIAERGYHIQAPAGRWPAGMPPVVFEDRSLIVTGFVSGLRASGFLEFARTRRPPDPSRWQVLDRHVRDLGLPFDAPIARWMGARPTLPDYLPAIGRSERLPAVHYAFGHQHLGLTLAAVTAELVRDLVTGQAPPPEIRPFDLARFGRTREP